LLILFLVLLKHYDVLFFLFTFVAMIHSCFVKNLGDTTLVVEFKNLLININFVTFFLEAKVKVLRHNVFHILLLQLLNQLQIRLSTAAQPSHCAILFYIFFFLSFKEISFHFLHVSVPWFHTHFFLLLL
jgi:hypothetical protein